MPQPKPQAAAKTDLLPQVSKVSPVQATTEQTLEPPVSTPLNDLTPANAVALYLYC